MELKAQRCRPTREMNCPHCGETVAFHNFSGMGDVAPHFYCDTCSNVFWSEAVRQRIYAREASPELLAEIEVDLPACPCGGRFKPGANPKCPHCRKEIPHQYDPVRRLDDPYAIVVKGARFVTPR